MTRSSVADYTVSSRSLPESETNRTPAGRLRGGQPEAFDRDNRLGLVEVIAIAAGIKAACQMIG